MSSLDLCLVSQVMYLRDGEINPGDEAKVARLEKKIMDWKRDIVDNENQNYAESTEPKPTIPTRLEMTNDMLELENKFNGYWCEGEKCGALRTHWVLNESISNCWSCMHDPCACSPPLVWDEAENAYYRFFLSCDGNIKTNIWMSEPTTDLAKINFKRREMKRMENEKREREEAECGDNQQAARDGGFCCHHHEKKIKLEEKKEREGNRRAKKDRPYQCIHCNEDPCAFIQIETRLCASDKIYFDEDDFKKGPAAYNSGRRKRAYQKAANILWGGINYRKQHFACVENGVRTLFPPLDGKTMGYKVV